MSEYSVLTEEELRLLPSDEDVRQYEETGWYLSKKLLSDAETETLTQASERFYAGHKGRVLPGQPDRLADWSPADGEIQRNSDYIHYRDEAIAGILRKPVVAAVAARLARTPEVRTFQATLIYKPSSPRRNVEHRFLAFRQVLLAHLLVRQHADRLHPFP